MSPVFKYFVHIGPDFEDINEKITAKNRIEADKKFSDMWPDITPSTVIETKTKKKSAPKK